MDMRTYLVSWNKPSRMFRFREHIEEEGMLVQEAEGPVNLLKVDNQAFRLHMQGQIVKYTPHGLIVLDSDPMEFEIPDTAVNMGHRLWRCCANRALNEFRMRPEDALRDGVQVANMMGRWNLVWKDRGSHVHHDGHFWYDEAANMGYVTH